MIIRLFLYMCRYSKFQNNFSKIEPSLHCQSKPMLEMACVNSLFNYFANVLFKIFVSTLIKLCLTVVVLFFFQFLSSLMSVDYSPMSLTGYTCLQHSLNCLAGALSPTALPLPHQNAVASGHYQSSFIGNPHHPARAFWPAAFQRPCWRVFTCPMEHSCQCLLMEHCFQQIESTSAPVL